jgi:hypothetical protein
LFLLQQYKHQKKKEERQKDVKKEKYNAITIGVLILCVTTLSDIKKTSILFF